MTDRVVHVVGARPNFMKAAPVIDAQRAKGRDPYLIHTGQHYDERLSAIFFDELGLPQPDQNLGVGSGTQAQQTGALLVAIESALGNLGPPLVVVYGDVNSTMAAALAATKLGIPVAHVEAGLRSYDRTMPEEINRVVTDAVSSVLLATSNDAVDHLIAEGITPASVHLVGNTMIDTLLRFREAVDGSETRGRFGFDGSYGVVTLHRPANVDRPERASQIVQELHRVADDLALLIPLHPRGRVVLEDAGLKDHPHVIVTDPLGYLEFMDALVGSALAITDSGGVQEETTILGVPCLTVRPNTERPITVTAGTNRLVEPGEVSEAAKDALSRAWAPAGIPLWDGGAGGRIAEVFEDLLAESARD